MQLVYDLLKRIAALFEAAEHIKAGARGRKQHIAATARHGLRRDYRLLHAWNGEQAVELCRKEHPHVILMDINMPVMNGYEAAAEIRKFAADIPIVAVTAYAYASDEQKIMQNGFTGYMPKPINAPQLKKQILDILRKRITLI